MGLVKQIRRLLSLLLLFLGTGLNFLAISHFYGLDCGPERFSPEVMLLYHLGEERAITVKRLRRYFGDDFRSVDGVSPEDAINLEKQIVVIPIYGLTPELEEEIRRISLMYSGGFALVKARLSPRIFSIALPPAPVSYLGEIQTLFTEVVRSCPSFVLRRIFVKT